MLRCVQIRAKQSDNIHVLYKRWHSLVQACCIADECVDEKRLTKAEGTACCGQDPGTQADRHESQCRVVLAGLSKERCRDQESNLEDHKLSDWSPILCKPANRSLVVFFTCKEMRHML